MEPRDKFQQLIEEVVPSATEESTHFPNTPTRFGNNLNAVLKAQIESLKMEFRSYQQQTDSRIVFLED